MDRSVKRLLVPYMASALCCTAVFGAGILSDKYASSLLTAYDQLQTIKVKKVNMKDAVRDIDLAIARLREEMPREMNPESIEADVLLTLDRLKTRFKSYTITIEALQKKETEVTLPVTIRGVLSDYPNFLGDLSYLQALKFPFFVVASLSMDKLEKDHKELVIFEIKGTLTMRTSFPTLTPGS